MFRYVSNVLFFFFQAEDGIRDYKVTGVQTCALPICRTRGIAVVESFGSFVAEVAEVSVSRSSGKVRVHRVVCAVDCGRHVNPDTVAAQMEGAIVYGLRAALKGQVTINKGRRSGEAPAKFPLPCK